MIKGFKNEETAKIYNEERSRKFPFDIQKTAFRKLEMLAAATSLKSLAVPPNNRLEKLRGKRAGQHSIRINGQWRICFRFEDGNAYDVEICDYH